MIAKGPDRNPLHSDTGDCIHGLGRLCIETAEVKRLMNGVVTEKGCAHRGCWRSSPETGKETKKGRSQGGKETCEGGI